MDALTGQLEIVSVDVIVEAADFNENMDASKEEALQQLERLDDIQAQIDEARQTTADAERDIGTAKLDAEQAQKMAEKALQDAKAITEVRWVF